MTNAEVKDMLRKYAEIDNKLYRLAREIREINEYIKEITLLKATRIDGLPHGTETSDPVYQVYIQQHEKYDSMLLEKQKEYNEALQLKEAISNKMKVLSEMEKDLLKWKFTDKLSDFAILYNLKMVYKKHIQNRQLSRYVISIYEKIT